MLLCFLMKWFTTAIALSLPIPAGIVAPAMIIGGLFGRTFAMCLPDWLVDLLLTDAHGTPTSAVDRGAFYARFAIIGAAAFTAAVCRAFAMAITVFEVLALPNAIIPLTSATLAAMLTAHPFALPYFDTNLVLRGLGGISKLTHTKKAQEPAFNVMRRIHVRYDCLEQHTTLGRMKALLSQDEEERKGPQEHFAVVQLVTEHWQDDGVIGILKGSISRKNLVKYVKSHESKPDDELINLTSPDVVRPDDRSDPVVNTVPHRVAPDTHCQDVYLMFRITSEKIVYVTVDNCVLGSITFKELLDHPL